MYIYIHIYIYIFIYSFLCRYGAKGEVVSLVTKRQSKAAEALQAALRSKRTIHAIDYGGKLSETSVRIIRNIFRYRYIIYIYLSFCAHMYIDVQI